MAATAATAAAAISSRLRRDRRAEPAEAHHHLDLPYVADWDEEPQRAEEMRERVARLVGRLETALDGGTIEDAVAAVREWLDEPLPYEPETPAQAAERHARLARTLREMRGS